MVCDIHIELLALRLQRSDIRDSKIIAPPPPSPRHNLSFPQLAFRYLSYQLCTTDHRGLPMRNPSRDLGAGQYLKIRKHYPWKMLDDAWTQWEALGKCKDGEAQRNNLYAIAKDLKDWRKLYRTVWKGMATGTEQERAAFHDEWFDKGVAEIEAILDTGVTLDELQWERFEELGKLYQSHTPAVRKDKSVEQQPESLAAEEDEMERRESQVHISHKGKERVVYGTPEPVTGGGAEEGFTSDRMESEPPEGAIDRRSPSLEL